MTYPFPTRANGETITDTWFNPLQLGVERLAVPVDAFGATGDGVTDDTTAVNLARTAAIANGIPLLFTGGKTYLVSQFDGWNNGVVIAHGATLLHSGGGGVLVNIFAGLGAANNIKRMVWRGGRLRAAQVAAGTSSVLYMKNAWNCEFSDVAIDGGDSSATEAVRYADYGILIEGRQNNGTYWNNWYGVNVRGCATAGVHVDGFETLTGLNHTGPNWWHGCRMVYNQTGFHVEGSNYEIFLGGQIEQNTSYGLVLDYYAKDTDAYGLHLEHNNGGAANPQFYVETRVPSGETVSQNSRRNSIRGAISGNPVNDLGDELAAVRHLALYQNVGSLQWGAVPTALRNLVLQRETTSDIAMQFDTDGETNARMRWTTQGQLQYRDPASDVASYFNAFFPSAMNEIITGADVVIWTRGGVKFGDGGATVKKAVKQFVNFDFPSIAANSTAELTVTITGAAVQDAVVAIPRLNLEAGLIWSAYVSAADTVTVRVANVTTSAVDAAARAWDVVWLDLT